MYNILPILTGTTVVHAVARDSDLPLHKETISSEMFGRFVAIADMAGLTKGVEYETAVKPMLQCSTKILWLDRVNDKLQITVAIKSLDMSVEYGMVDKTTKAVIHREKLEGLRYKISNDTNIELTDGSRERFDELLTSFKGWFEKLKAA